MSNPVCYFDIEIGGQPAGRIEMTVRLRARARERDARPARATFDRIAADRAPRGEYAIASGTTMTDETRALVDAGSRGRRAEDCGCARASDRGADDARARAMNDRDERGA